MTRQAAEAMAGRPVAGRADAGHSVFVGQDPVPAGEPTVTGEVGRAG